MILSASSVWAESECAVLYHRIVAVVTCTGIAILKMAARQFPVVWHRFLLEWVTELSEEQRQCVLDRVSELREGQLPALSAEELKRAALSSRSGDGGDSLDAGFSGKYARGNLALRSAELLFLESFGDTGLDHPFETSKHP